MSTWRIAREAGVSRPPVALPVVTGRRRRPPWSPGTSRKSGSGARVGLHRLVHSAAESLDLRFQRVDAIEHLLDGLGERIGQIRVVEIEARRDFPAIPVDHLARNADHDGVWRDL